MIKIMLVVDDYNEMTFLETFLKKLGFDVLGLSKDTGVTERLLGFPAEVMLMSARGKMVDGIQLMKKVKKSNPSVKLVLLHPQQAPPQLTDVERFRLDGLVELPTDPTKLIHLLARLGRMDADVLLEKYAKLSQANKSKDADPRWNYTKEASIPLTAVPPLNLRPEVAGDASPSAQIGRAHV